MQIKNCWPAAAPLTSLMLRLAGEESCHGHGSQWGWGIDRRLAFPESCWSSYSSSLSSPSPPLLFCWILVVATGTPRMFFLAPERIGDD